MNKEELVARIDSLASNAVGGDDSDISIDRANALDHYYGRPYGDEKDGRSKVVSKDLSETVDWIMPSLMKVFIGSGNVVEFLPVGPEDEELAQQETDYVNHVMLEQNDGFLYLHDVFKDALIQKNGYIKAYWEYIESSTVERYRGLSLEEATALFHEYEMDGAEVEVIAQDERMEAIMVQDQHTEIPVVDLEIRVVRHEGKECIEAIPTEEVRVSRRARGNLNDCDYVEHKTRKPRTELIHMGMDEKFVNSLPPESGDDLEEQEQARNSTNEESEYNDEAIDPSMAMIEYREVQCKVDFDGDGRAERRKVVIVGGKIPDGEEWNQEIDHYNIYYGTPKRMPHRHVGESIDDELQDLQKIKTVLLRLTLDNTYNQVNQEYLVNERVNLEDFLVTRPSGVKRVMDKHPIGDCAKVIEKPNILPNVLPVIQHVDQIKANRTGVNPPVTGVDPNVLKEVREKVASDNLDKANAKIEMIARMLAEILVKPLARGVHADLIQYQDKAKTVKLRNQWVSINPQEWRNRTDLRVTVGLGNGNREELKETIRLIAEAQGALSQYGLVGPKQAYNSFTKLAKALGEVNPESYAMNPESDEYKQHIQQMSQNQGNNPLAEVEMIKQQSQQQIAQMKEQNKAQIEQIKMKAQQDREMLEMRMKYQEQLQKQNMEWMIAKMKEENQNSRTILQEEVKTLIEGYKVDVGKPGIGGEFGRT